MSLTKSQTLTLYTILEVPYSTAPHQVDPSGTFATPVYDSSITDLTRLAKTKIDAYIASDIETDADIEAVLVGLIAQYAALGTNVESVNGSIGSLQGLEYSVAKERAEIQRQVLVIVPFFRYHEQLQSNRNSNPWRNNVV